MHYSSESENFCKKEERKKKEKRESWKKKLRERKKQIQTEPTTKSQLLNI